ncbi:MAG: M48 family metallopeptidase [Rubripirellula sp.]|nr:M48 family metallopeptidase [Rubripirellula sp.]
MATSFYQRQDAARKNTTKLVALFIIAVVLIVGLVSAATWYAIEEFATPRSLAGSSGFDRPSNKFSLFAGLGTLALVILGSLYKVVELRRGGGTLVAESLGGRRISPQTKVADQRKLMNIVEEMALASGVPVPPVYLINEDGINAFAAGYSPSDAVLGVTTGCISQLSRDELQGVIAHEFSHILNGDMRMSIKLMGVLHGILLIGLTGQIVLRSLMYGGGRSRRNKKDNEGGGVLVIIVIAVAAIAIGFIGVFFGNLIKAAVSRQREFLADSSAVQFTRNPDGIAGALKRIGGNSNGSRIENSNASEASHLFFSQAVWEGIGGLWATHPPLAQRIRSIDANWDGKFTSTSKKSSQRTPPRKGATSPQSALTSGFAGASSETTAETPKPATATGHATSPSNDSSGVIPLAAAIAEEAPLGGIHNALESVGDPSREHQQYASTLIADLPARLLDAIRDPFGARVVVYCLLLDTDFDIRHKQLGIIKKLGGNAVHILASRLAEDTQALEIQKRLPVIDLCLASLRSLSKNQYKDFINCFNELVKADKKIDLFEWIIIQVITRHLKPHFESTKPSPEGHEKLRRLSPECSVLLSAIATAGNDSEVAGQAFKAGVAELKDLSLKQIESKTGDLNRLAKALNSLRRASASERKRLINACSVAIEADGHITWQEAELLRGVGDLLDCPIPPIIPTMR